LAGGHANVNTKENQPNLLRVVFYHPAGELQLSSSLLWNRRRFTYFHRRLLMYLSKEQLTATLRLAWKASRRDHLMILLGAQHGLRRTEIASLTLSDVANGRISVARIKGSEPTIHPLLSNKDILLDEIRALEYYLAERTSESNLLFPSSHGGALTGRAIAYLMKPYMLAAGVPAELAHPHSLKHFCCSHLCRQNVGVEYVRTYVGHKDIKNTVRYLNITDSEASAKAQEAFK
jgi:site-specific recombinase XerD